MEKRISICLILLIFLVGCSQATLQAPKSNEITELTLSQDNFIYVENYNVNRETILKQCEDLLKGKCSPDPVAPRSDCYTWTHWFIYKLPFSYGEQAYSNLKCNANSDEVPLGFRSYDENYTFLGMNYELRFLPLSSDQNIHELSVPLDIRKDNDISICCQVKGQSIVSNKICHGPIRVEKLC